MDLNLIFADPRRRTLVALAAAALVSLVLAIVVIWQESEEGASAPAPETFFPGFAHQERSAARIHVVAKTGAFDLRLGR